MPSPLHKLTILVHFKSELVHYVDCTVSSSFTFKMSLSMSCVENLLQTIHSFKIG